MITTTPDKKLRLACNSCQAVANTPDFEEGEFKALQEWMTENGWQRRRAAGEWQHDCPDCARFRDRRLL